MNEIDLPVSRGGGIPRETGLLPVCRLGGGVVRLSVAVQQVLPDTVFREMPYGKKHLGGVWPTSGLSWT